MTFKYLTVGLLLCHVCTGNNGDIDTTENKSTVHLGYRNFYDNHRIINGNDATAGQFPHQVLIFETSFQHKTVICGGSILNSEWIVTAGHCVFDSIYSPPKYLVSAGKHVLQADEESEQISNVSLAIVHENYNGNVGPNDIALLKLTSAFVLNERVAPVTLPKKDVIHKGVATLSGWGSLGIAVNGSTFPAALQTVDIPILSYEECEVAFNNIIDNSQLEPSNVCTGPVGGNVSACFGDSGGPLVQYNDEKVELVGIVSWGLVPCGSSGAPTVYTKVSHFVDWIDAIIAKANN